MVAMDALWDNILTEILLGNNGKPRKREWKKEDIDKLHIRPSIDPKITKATNKMLYMNLLEYSNGDAHARVKTNGPEGSFESFRYIVAKGRNANANHKIAVRAHEMNLEAAKSVKDIEKKLSG